MIQVHTSMYTYRDLGLFRYLQVLFRTAPIVDFLKRISAMENLKFHTGGSV